MKVLGVDVETTGLSIGSSQIIEIACAMYCTKSKRVVNSYSSLVYEPNYPLSEKEAFDAHEIDLETLKTHGKQPEKTWNYVLTLFKEADAICAHNGNNFDKLMIEHEFMKHGFHFKEMLWIDTRLDIPYPNKTTSLRLIHLAADHNIYYPKKHSAVHDVEVMLDILSCYDIDQILERAKSPMINISADVDYKQNHLAKARRYRWDAKRKIWHKDIKEFDFQKEKDESPFKIRREG